MEWYFCIEILQQPARAASHYPSNRLTGREGSSWKLYIFIISLPYLPMAPSLSRLLYSTLSLRFKSALPKNVNDALCWYLPFKGDIRLSLERPQARTMKGCWAGRDEFISRRWFRRSIFHGPVLSGEDCFNLVLMGWFWLKSSMLQTENWQVSFSHFPMKTQNNSWVAWLATLAGFDCLIPRMKV